MQIFEYNEYRKILKDFYEKTKSADATFSYRVFARWAGFKSPNFIHQVIQNKANLSRVSTEKIAEAMELNTQEKKYFILLVQMEQSESEEDRIELYSKIVKLKAFQKYRPLNRAQHLYLSKWYYSAIKEMINLESFKESPKWINNMLKTNLADTEIEAAISDLIVLGLISRDTSKRLQIVENAVITTDQITSIFLKSYHQQFINLAVESMDKFDENLREIHGITLPVSKEMVVVYQNMILKFKEEIIMLAEKDKNFESVYQINLNFFPLAIKDPL